MSIGALDKLSSICWEAHEVTRNLKAIQSFQQEKELNDLSNNYKDSADNSRWLAILSFSLMVLGPTTLSTVAYSVFNAPSQKSLQEVLLTLSRNGSEISRAVVDIGWGHKKTLLDGKINILNSKINAHQGQGPSAAKTAEEQMQQAASQANQLFQKAVHSAA
jgi:hypothetical protein